MSVSAIRIPAKSTAKSAVIFLHGLGDSGEGWSWFPQLIKLTGIINSDSINYVFPNAPTIPITVNGGYRMPGWYDLYDFSDPNSQQDTKGFINSCNVLKELIKEQHEVNNIPHDNIIIGGFSQGASLALATLTMLDVKIAGVVALSGFCPIKNQIKDYMNEDTPNKETPVFQGHGEADPLINVDFGRQTADLYKGLGFGNYTFKTYGGVAHSANEEELGDVVKFMKGVIG